MNAAPAVSGEFAAGAIITAAKDASMAELMSKHAHRSAVSDNRVGRTVLEAAFPPIAGGSDAPALADDVDLTARVDELLMGLQRDLAPAHFDSVRRLLVLQEERISDKADVYLKRFMTSLAAHFPGMAPAMVATGRHVLMSLDDLADLDDLDTLCEPCAAQEAADG